MQAWRSAGRPESFAERGLVASHSSFPVEGVIGSGGGSTSSVSPNVKPKSGEEVPYLYIIAVRTLLWPKEEVKFITGFSTRSPPQFPKPSTAPGTDNWNYRQRANFSGEEQTAMATEGFTITPIQTEDFPALARISAQSFVGDSNTEVKAGGKEGYDMEKMSLDGLPSLIANPNIVGLKATENSSGEIMGYIVWGFRGFERDEIPVPEGSPKKVEAAPTLGRDVESGTEAEEEKESMSEDPALRLNAISGKFMTEWMREVMPPGTKCLFIYGLSVSPKFQRRGVGKALLKWGTDVVDSKGVFAWVSSSDGGKHAYVAGGFEVARSLTVNLDQYATIPAPAPAYKDGKWGDYTWWKMVYQSQTSLAEVGKIGRKG